MFVYWRVRESSFYGHGWKAVTCDACGAEWAFRVEVRLYGSAHALSGLDQRDGHRHASDSAARAFDEVVDAAVPDAPCPRCGRFQAAAVRRQSKRRYAWLGDVGMLGMVLGLVCGLFAIMSVLKGGEPLVSPQAMGALGATLAIVGAAALIARRPLERRFSSGSRPDGVAAGDVPGVLLRDRYEQILAAAQTGGKPLPLPPLKWPARS
jgi:hypothetical protein